MKFAEKYVPITSITDDVYACPFSDFPCLKSSGIAVGEAEFKFVDLYFPIDDSSKENDLGCVDYTSAIAVYSDKGATFANTVQVSDLDLAVHIIINGERYSVISAIYEIEALYKKAETIRDTWISVDIVINDNGHEHTVTKSDYMDNMISYLNSLI